MPDRRPLMLATALSIASLVVATVAVLRADRERDTANAADPTTRNAAFLPTDSWPLVAEILPEGTTLASADPEARITGLLVCGSCRWGFGEYCNTVLWSEERGLVATVLPNARLGELEPLASHADEDAPASGAT